MKVCFINPPNPFGKAPLPHMGLAYIVGMLKQEYNDIQVDIIDCPFQQLSSNELREELKCQEYDVIGITTYFYNFSEVFKLVRFIKKMKKDTFVILGGYYPTLHPKKAFYINGINCISMGEGEYFYKKLIYALKNGTDWKNIHGVGYLDENDELVLVPPDPLIQDLDSIPLPYIVKEPLYWYPLVSGRGCHGHCTFCSIIDYYKKVPGNKIRKRCPQSVVSEMKQITDKYKNKIIWMMDDNFLSVLQFDAEWIDKFVSLMKEENVKCKFKIFVRSDELDPVTMRKLQEVGLWGVVVGVESVIPRQLKLYGKNITAETNYNALETAEKLGLWLDMGFILLDPFTSMNELKLNLNFLRNSKFLKTAEPGHELISSLGPLIVLEDTPIERYLRNKDILSGSDVGYNFQCDGIAVFYKYLQMWNKLVAPAYFKFNQEKIFYYYEEHGTFDAECIQEYRKCLEIDIDCMIEIFTLIKENPVENEVDSVVLECIDKYKEQFMNIVC